MSVILAMDTSGPSLSVALMRDGLALFECVRRSGLTHSESLMPMVDEALRAGKLSMADVDLVAVVKGPGSFTGVRIGVSSAIGLSQALNKPCVGINALEAMAFCASLFDGVVCPLQDARASQVYAAAFRKGKRVMPDEAVSLDEYLERVASFGRCCFVGDGADRHREAILSVMGKSAIFPSEGWMGIRGSCVAQLAYMKQGEAGSWRTLAPYYLRAPQAERERTAKEAQSG